MMFRYLGFTFRKMMTRNRTTEVWECNRWIATITWSDHDVVARRTFWPVHKKNKQFMQPEDTTVGDVLESEHRSLPDQRLYWVVVRATKEEVEVKLCRNILAAMIEAEKLTGLL